MQALRGIALIIVLSNQNFVQGLRLKEYDTDDVDTSTMTLQEWTKSTGTWQSLTKLGEYVPKSPDALIGLAHYEKGFSHNVWKFLKSARMAGYDGHIFLGVHPNFFENKLDVAKFAALGVTPKKIELGPCELPYETPKDSYMLREVCSADFPHQKLESARFTLAAKWLEDCKTCTGWVAQMDVEDTFIQRPVFKGMGTPKGNELIMVEEFAPPPQQKAQLKAGTTKHWFVEPAVESCYGYKIEEHPMLCSGSIIGAKEQYVKFLNRFAQEFEDNVKRGAKCDPTKIADQAVLNHLFYSKALASLGATTQKYGEGIVNTVGNVCSTEQTKKGEFTEYEGVLQLDGDGYVLNRDNSVANVVHQDKVCWKKLVLKHVYPRYEGVSVEKIMSDLRKM